MRAMGTLLHRLRRHRTVLSTPIAVVLLLVAPFCAAACGGHVDAPSHEAPAEVAHADCHGAMPPAPADDAADTECCDEDASALQAERAQTLPDAVLAFTGVALDPFSLRSAPPRARDPSPGGRSPGKVLLLLILSFLE